MFEDYFDALKQREEMLKQLAYPSGPTRSPASGQVPTKSVPQTPPGTAPFYDLEHQTVTNTVAPVAPQFRDELQNELNKMRGIDNARNVYSFEKQKEGLQDLTSQIEKLREMPEPAADPMIPMLGAAQWLASPSGTPPEILGTYKMVKDAQSRKEAERRDLVEKLMALKQKQETGIANSDVAYLKAMIPQIMQGREITTTKDGYRPIPDHSNKPKYDENKVEADVQKLQKNIGDQIPGIVSNIKELNGYLGGIGNTNNTQNIPGIGPAMKLAPDFLLSKEGSRVRQLVTDLYRAKVYQDSGKAITEKEARDEMKTLGLTFDAKESSFRQGVKGLAEKLTQQIRNKEAAYRPEVKEVWKSRGGLSSQDLVDVMGFAPQDAAGGLTPEQAKRVDELLKKAKQ